MPYSVTRRVAHSALDVTGVLRTGGSALATLRLVRYGELQAVLKDYSAARFFFRHSLAPLLTRREVAAYRRLGDIPGVPRFLGRVGPDGILLEYIPGRNARDPASGPFTAEFFQKLRELASRIRGEGVLHFDIKRNVVNLNGSPHLVDFVTAVVLPRWLGPLRGSLIRLAAQYDEREIVKLKELTAPSLVTEAERQSRAKVLPFEWSVRGCERLINASVRLVARQQEHITN